MVALSTHVQPDAWHEIGRSAGFRRSVLSSLQSEQRSRPEKSRYVAGSSSSAAAAASAVSGSSKGSYGSSSPGASCIRKRAGSSSGRLLNSFIGKTPRTAW